MEVRKLAERSQIAAAEIADLSKTTGEDANHVGELLRDLVPSIQRTSDLVQEIATASSEQRTGAEQINNAMIQLDQVIQHNVSSSEEISAMVEELDQQAASLDDAVQFFKLDDNSRKRKRREKKEVHEKQQKIQTVQIPVEPDDMDDSYSEFAYDDDISTMSMDS